MSLPFNQGQSMPGLGISGGVGAQAAGMFPGGGLAEALAGRTVSYGGQLAAIGIEGATQTFLPDDSPLANFSGTLPGKLLGHQSPRRALAAALISNHCPSRPPPVLMRRQRTVGFKP